MKIEKSTDHSIFSFLESNRPLSPVTLSKLRESISRYNMLDLFPIIVDGEFNIIDGQHRFTVAKEMNLPVYYIMEKNPRMDMIPVVNSASFRWTLYDYVHHYAKEGNPHYVEMKSLLDKYKMPATCIRYWYSHNSSTNVYREVKEGLVTSRLPDWASGCLDIAYECNKDLEASGIKLWNSRYMHVAWKSFLQSELIDHQVFKDKWKAYSHRFRGVRDTEQLIRSLLDIYCYRSGEKLYIARAAAAYIIVSADKI